MREVAKYMRQLRNISSEFQSQFSEELKVLDEINPRRILNDVIDPNNPAATQPNPAAPAAKPASAKPAAPAKPAATAATAKPLTPKPVPSPASANPDAVPHVTNGEPGNVILPPAKPLPPAESPANGTDLPASSSPQLAADALPPAGVAPATPVDLPPEVSSGQNSAGPAASAPPADPGAEASL
jgi:hypothetical protein